MHPGRHGLRAACSRGNGPSTLGPAIWSVCGGPGQAHSTHSPVQSELWVATTSPARQGQGKETTNGLSSLLLLGEEKREKSPAQNAGQGKGSHSWTVPEHPAEKAQPEQLRPAGTHRAPWNTEVSPGCRKPPEICSKHDLHIGRPADQSDPNTGPWLIPGCALVGKEPGC